MTRAKAAAAKVALENLLAGNQRFVKSERAPRDFQLRREKLLQGQKPMAIILACSDSRVAPEMLFDKNLGEIFVIRTAGQVLEPVALASIEYAVDHLQVPLFMILGHEQCGAVTAAVHHQGPAPGNIGVLLDKIRPAIERARALEVPPEEMVEKVTDLHLEELAQQSLRDSEILRQAVAAGKLRVVIAKYRLASGKVDIFHDNYQGMAVGSA
jgi:carbonic anhydrase